ncbi:MAG: 5-formyltetrahydrofolate cyclo-ligase [Proteobacteria bacterium]|nr:5-formyltetrahydrofolate cyclo-ligase [Pseudomonadota bacterium]
MDLAERKRALRRQMAPLRRALSAAESAAVGAAAATLVVATPEFARARVVALYAARSDEVSTRRLYEELRRVRKRWVVPRCTDTGLEFAATGDWDDLRPGRYGVLEPPAEAEAVELGPGDLVIVPGVAFDARGGRLGRGRGYYDRTFPPGRAASPILFGLAASFQIVDEVPAGPADRGMDAVVTERGLIRGGTP